MSAWFVDSELSTCLQGKYKQEYIIEKYSWYNKQALVDFISMHTFEDIA